MVRAGGLVIYPTETLWGLGCDPADARAVSMLRRVKGTPAEQPLSVALSGVERLWDAIHPTPLARALAMAHLPGPLTLVSRPRTSITREWKPVLGFGELLGLRVPYHPVARSLLNRSGPLVSTSANLHGHSPVTDGRQAAELLSILEERIGTGTGTVEGSRMVLVDGGPPPSGVGSTVILLDDPKPKVLRYGAIGGDVLDLDSYLSKPEASSPATKRQPEAGT